MRPTLWVAHAMCLVLLSWVPAEMKEVVEAVLGCAWFPDNPEDVYRYPPPAPAP